jgi:hypothetical protein
MLCLLLVVVEIVSCNKFNLVVILSHVNAIIHMLSCIRGVLLSHLPITRPKLNLITKTTLFGQNHSKISYKYNKHYTQAKYTHMSGKTINIRELLSHCIGLAEKAGDIVREVAKSGDLQVKEKGKPLQQNCAIMYDNDRAFCAF